MNKKIKKILVTGSAGFIGFFVSEYLLKIGHEIVGIDNHNYYYLFALILKFLASFKILFSIFEAKLLSVTVSDQVLFISF